MFTNGIVAEIEVDSLNDIESAIEKKHGLNRKFTMLNVQFCKKKGEYSHATGKYNTHHYYKVFFMIGETYEQARISKEDREQLRREKQKERKSIEAEQDYMDSLSDSELAAYKKEKKDKADKAIAVLEAKKKEKESLPSLKKKLEEAKKNASNINTKKLWDKLNGKH